MFQALTDTPRDLDECSEAIDAIVDTVRRTANEGDPDGASDFLDNAIERLVLEKARVHA